MYIELLLIIDFLCFICLLMLYYKTEKQSKALQEMRECNQSLLNVIKRMNKDVGILEANTFKEVKELKQEIREIHKAIEYLCEEKK